MSLGYRLLLVYLIVVLLTAATVGVALLELQHSRGLVEDLHRWNEIVVKVQKLRTAFEWEAHLPRGDEPMQPPEGLVFETWLTETRKLLDFDMGRWHLQVVERDYRDWRVAAGLSATRPQTATSRAVGAEPLLEATDDSLAAQTNAVRSTLNRAGWFFEGRQTEVMNQNEEQASRTMAVLNLVCALLALHVLTVGWLLGRWLLVPMARLSRQVEALARDAPPSEPLLTSPPEMAGLAVALERARVSLGEMRTRLVESERLTTLGQFAAQLAHNLRNPLASIRAIAQVAARHDPGNGQVQRRMAEIIGSVDRLNRWIAGLMEVVRHEPTATRMLDVIPVLHRVREALTNELAAKELVLDVDTPRPEVVCWHDPGTLEHALIAMVINAVEASPVGGRIVMRVEPDLPGVCRVSVIDQGAGLPGENPERIFDSSYSTKQEGMGLGLALARLALDRQGGATGAANSPAGGAVVYIELPTTANDLPKGENR